MYDYDPRYQIGMRSILEGDPDDERYEEFIEDTLCVLEDLYNLPKDASPETWAKEFVKYIDWCNLGVNEHSYCNKTSDLVELSVHTGWLQTADELVEVIATKILEAGGNNGV